MFSCGAHCFKVVYRNFNFRGYKGPRKLKTVNINPYVFGANPRKFGDAKISHFTVCVEPYSPKEPVTNTTTVYLRLVTLYLQMTDQS